MNKAGILSIMMPLGNVLNVVTNGWGLRTPVHDMYDQPSTATIKECYNQDVVFVFCHFPLQQRMSQMPHVQGLNQCDSRRVKNWGKQKHSSATVPVSEHMFLGK